jgi:hypothetical protein
MSNRTLTNRVESLERELDALRLAVAQNQLVTPQTLRVSVEEFSGDQNLLVVFAKAMESRELDRKRGRAKANARRKRA